MEATSSKAASLPTSEPHQAGNLAPVGASFYAVQRTRRDNGWAVAYLVLAALIVVGGFYTIARGHSVSSQTGPLTPAFFSHSLTCDPEVFDVSYSAFQTRSGGNVDTAFNRKLGKSMAIWLPITALIGIPVAIGYLLLHKNHSKEMIKYTMYGLLGYSVTWAVISFIAGGFIMGFIQLVATGILLLAVYCVRHHLPLCAELFGVAGRALAENTRIIPTVLACKLAGLGAVIYMVAALMCATEIGQVKSSPVAYTREQVSGDVANCYSVNGTIVNCCQFELEGFPAFYIVLAAITIPWTMLLVLQIKLQVIADFVSQWYYKPPGAFTNSEQEPSIQRAVNNALTTGFGTASFAAAIIFLLEAIRSAVRRASRNNLLCMLLSVCVIQPLLNIMEQLTRFAVITAAITNQGLWDAGSHIVQVFKRNLLQTMTVWWVPNMVIKLTVGVASLAWAVVPFVIVTATNKGEDIGIALLTSLVCFFVMLMILSIGAGVLLDCIDTVYVCYSLDRDQRIVTRPEFHAIYQEVSSKQAVVIQNPGGELQYGQATEMSAQQPAIHGAAPQPAAPPRHGYQAPVDQQPLLSAGVNVPYAPYQYSTPHGSSAV